MLVISGKGNGNYKKAKFMLEDEGPFKGWTDGSKSSGWDCPVFEKKEADRIMNSHNAFFDNEEQYAKYDEATDTYIFPLYDGDKLEEVWTYKSIMIDTPKGKVKAYGIGEDWVWEKV